MDRVRHLEIFDLRVMVRIVLMKHGDGTAVTGDINPVEARIELDDVRSVRHRKKSDRFVFVEVENRHQIVFFTRQKRAVMLRVKAHAVVSLAAADWIAAYYFVVRGIDDGKNVLILEIYIGFLGDRIVLRHSLFTVAMQSLAAFILVYVPNRFRLPRLAHNVTLGKRDAHSMSCP